MIVIFILKSTNAKYDDKSANNIKINKTMLTCIIKEYQNTRRNTRAQRKHSKNQCHNGITLPISKTEDTNYLKNNNNKKPTQLRILHLPKKSTKCKSRNSTAKVHCDYTATLSTKHPTCEPWGTNTTSKPQHICHFSSSRLISKYMF